MLCDYEEEAFIFAKFPVILYGSNMNKKVKHSQSWLTIAQLLPRNCSFHVTIISIIQQQTNGDPGLYGTQSEFEIVQANINLDCQDHMLLSCQ